MPAKPGNQTSHRAGDRVSEPADDRRCESRREHEDRPHRGEEDGNAQEAIGDDCVDAIRGRSGTTVVTRHSIADCVVDPLVAHAGNGGSRGRTEHGCQVLSLAADNRDDGLATHHACDLDLDGVVVEECDREPAIRIPRAKVGVSPNRLGRACDRSIHFRTEVDVKRAHAAQSQRARSTRAVRRVSIPRPVLATVGATGTPRRALRRVAFTDNPRRCATSTMLRATTAGTSISRICTAMYRFARGLPHRRP